jgi:hypothetical protein
MYTKEHKVITIQEQRQQKENRAKKFTSISEMRTHHNAIQTLYKNGYDKGALKHIAGEFQDSIQYALDEVNHMRNNMSDIVNS